MNLRDFLFSFRGRINRAAFPFVLPFIVAVLVFGFMMRNHVLGPGIAGTGLLALTIAFSGYIFAAAAAKRLQDQNRHGAWMLLWFVPLLLATYFWRDLTGVFALDIGLPFRLQIAHLFFLWGAVECVVLPGTKGDNRFGPQTDHG